MEQIKKEFESIFTIHDQTTLNKIMEFIEQKLKEEATKHYLKGINECEEKYVIPLREQLVEMTRLRDFWHKETQKEHAELKLERAKAIDECIAICQERVDKYTNYLSDANLVTSEKLGELRSVKSIMKSIQQLKEVSNDH